jgi:molybdopterin molybdotransferase
VAAAGGGPVAVEDAVALLDGSVPRLGAESVGVERAAGRVLAAPVRSAHPLPPFDQSGVDGYAVRHADVVGSPVTLGVVDHVAAAPQARRLALEPSTAVRILTGGLVPEGADTIVRQELTSPGPGAGTITVLEPVAVGTDLRRQGGELPSGAVVADAGALVGPGLLGALVAAGATVLDVVRRPTVRVLVTGDELVAHGRPRGPGQVTDANGPMIAATLRGWGVEDVEVVHVADRREATAEALAVAFDDADLVVTSGGVSVGDFDFVPAAAEEVGAERLVWKVAQRPGGPLYVARRGHVHLFGLPGNPAAVLVNLHVYVRRALDLQAGLDPDRRWHWGAGGADVVGLADRTLWLRAVAETDRTGTVRLRPLGRQASHMLTNLAQATALVQVPVPGPGGPPTEYRWTPIA